ncbi:transient receptor potential cation channel protein painless-like [Frankliniella occidentalis]|uniref:Transient receptor potential cation channel protein painless-like n=1 Tax=Frankliniella occidentalis TaxID=133901 RepID=A0A9C6X1N5_FRAOC|nr:transient receptor potential cation channel protein painless-like [Frankliniella occidentalis]
MGAEDWKVALPGRPENGCGESGRTVSPNSPDLSDELASAYRDMDLETFVELLSGSPPEVDPDHWYPDLSPPSTLLELASRETDRGPYVRALLAAGADANRINPFHRNAPLHVAAEAGNASSMEELLRAETVDVNKQDLWGCTPLHLAAFRMRLREPGSGTDIMGGWVSLPSVSLSEEKRDELEHGYQRCVQLLMRHPCIDVNKAHGRRGLTAVHMAAKGDAPAAMLSLLLAEGGSRLVVDAGSDIDGRTAREVIRDKHPQLARHLPPLQAGTHAQDKLSADSLFFYLYSRESERFLAALHQQHFLQHAGLLDADDGSHTLLQLASKEGLHDVAKALLKGGADPNRTAASDGPKHSPLDLACFHGHYRVVRALVTDPRTDLEASGLSDRPLHAAVRGAAEASQEDGGVHAHCRCVKILLARGVDVNASNEGGDTALLCAAQHGLSQLVSILLKGGAVLSSLEYMTPHVLRAHFDDCISTNGLSPHAKNYAVVFDYTNFTDPYKPSSQRMHRGFQTNAPPAKQMKKAASPQTAEPGGGQGASYGWRDPNTTASEVRQPTTPGNQVTVSVEDSTSHIKGQKKMEETWELDFIGLVLSAGDLRMQELVRHPLVASFLDLKWQLVKRIYIFFNLLSHLIFSVGVTVYATFREFKKVLVIASLEETPKSVLIGVVFIYAIVECVRVSQRFKLFIRFFGWRKLVSSLQDWMAISSIVVTSVMLATDSTNVYLRRQLAAVCVLTTWIRHILIWAPISQQLATSIVMVKRVSWQCFKVLRNYGILIVAFALSFYILFHNCPIDGTGPDCPDDETGDDEFFRNPAKSIFKSFVMLTGEFDASSLPFDSFPVTSHILFLLFVFLVSIVLFNLILGLALSDTQAIRQEAELWAHVLRAEHLLFSKFALARWWSERLPSIMLFSRDKRERRIRVLPSDGNRVTYPMEKSSKLYKYLHTLRMDSDIMRKVNELLLERKSQSNVN